MTPVLRMRGTAAVHRARAVARRSAPRRADAGAFAPAVAGLAMCAIASGALAQGAPQQVVRGPVATYWITADTASGLGAMAGGGMGSMLGMLAGRAAQPVRSLELRLGSTRAPAGPPEAAHLIPPAMAMGAELPLTSPEPSRPTPARAADPVVPGASEPPKGRMLVYWGCGESVGPGQPVVLDFAKAAAGGRVPELVSRAVRQPRGPSPDSHRGYGAWPNERDRQAVPAQASLRGEHRIRASYAPEIRFTVDRHDFLAPVELESAPLASGARRFAWKAISGATGYFASAFGTAQSGDGTDIVMWTSSAVQETGGALAEPVAPAEVARLIRERVVMAPDRTECALPAAVVKAMPAGMLNFVAYGDELNVAHPPRPADPKVPWDVEWAVKLRTRSTAMQPLGALGDLSGGGGAGRGAAADDAAGARTADADASASPSAGTPPPSAGTPTEAVEQGVREGVRMLRGLIGR
jgi:hypothetical protein